MHKKILFLCFPLLLSNSIIPLVGLFNIHLMGNLSSHQALAALGIGTTTVNLILSLLHCVRMSTTGLIAQAFGENNHQQSATILFRAFLISLLLGGILIISTPVINTMMQTYLHSSTIISLAASGYIKHRMIATPAFLMNSAIIGFFIGIQQPKKAFLITLNYGFLSVMTSHFLVCVIHLGLNGLAISEVFSQYTTLLLGFVMCWHYFHYKIPFKNTLLRLDSMSELKDHITINADIFIRSLCLISSLALFTICSARLGEVTLAVNTMLLAVQNLTANVLDALADVTESCVGKAYGKQSKSLLKCLKLTLMWTTIAAFTITGLYWIFEKGFINQLSNIQSIQQTAYHVWPLFLLITFISCFSYWFDGVFIGLIETRKMRNAMLISAALFCLCTFILQPYHNIGLLIGLCLFFLLRSVTLIGYLITFRMTNNHHSITKNQQKC